MSSYSDNFRPALFALGLALLMSACSEDESRPQEPGVNGTYLYVSVPEFYFGTRDIGSRATQKIELANRGADIYPIRTISLSGDNADEFETDIVDGFELGPAEAVTINVRFTPITEGRKFADLAVDYDTIQLVDDAVNQHEQSYYAARDLEQAGEFGKASATYQRYVEGDPVTSNLRRAAIKLPVIEEGRIYDASDDLSLYLQALDARDKGDYDQARADLQSLRSLFPQSHLVDDAWYLDGYISLMDEQKPDEALASMTALKQRHPDSAYYDTALYSEALAQKDLGNREIAREILLDLRYRHTGFEALGMSYPKDDLSSRLWFSRAETALEQLDTGA